MTATNSSRRATSVWVLPIDSGGCGACVQQMQALLGPRYADELRSRGIAMTLSPRHADIVLLAGPLTGAAREPVARLIESVPQPRVLIAVGDCAINGCVFQGSPAVAESAAEQLDVNVEIGGCPPTPADILDAITEASGILAADTGAPGNDVGVDSGNDELITLDEIHVDGVSADRRDGEDA